MKMKLNAAKVLATICFLSLVLSPWLAIVGIVEWMQLVPAIIVWVVTGVFAAATAMQR